MNPDSSAEGSLARLCEAQRAEIERLNAALHRARAHPDYTYMVVPVTRMECVTVGWELNVHYEAAPGDECWRRRKAP